MDKRCKIYVEMLKLVSDIYKNNKNDYEKTLEIIKKYNKDDKYLIKELINILNYIKKLYITYEKRIKNIDEDLIIINGIDNSYKKLIEIYKKIYKDNNIDIELMILIIIPSISIKMKSGYEIIDFNIGSCINKSILKILNENDLEREVCPICFEKCDKISIMSNCCCYKTCLRCFELLSSKCAICKEEKPVIII
jgi:hypothetical protein